MGCCIGNTTFNADDNNDATQIFISFTLAEEKKKKNLYILLASLHNIGYNFAIISCNSKYGQRRVWRLTWIECVDS